MVEQPDGSQNDGSQVRDKRSSALERVQMLEVASAVTVNIEILRETYDEVLAVARASGYDEDEGVRAVFLSGLGYELGRLHLDALSREVDLGTELSAARVDAIVNDLAAYHSMYSVLKYKAFKLYKLNQRLEFNNAGLRAQEKMWNEWADRMRRERETLNGEVLRLRSILSEFQLDWEESGGPPLPPGLVQAAQLPPETEPERQEEIVTPGTEEVDDNESDDRGLWRRLLRYLGIGRQSTP